MSDFKAKISAELDTSKIEQQIDELNGKKIKLDVDTGDTSKDVQNVNKQIVNTRKSTQSFGDTLKKSFNIGAAASLTSEAFDAIRTAADKACDAIKDFDSAITDLRMATGGTYQEVYDLVKGYNQLGKAMGATTTEVSDSADAWLRQGHSISDTNTLIKDSMILAKVAKLDSADSTEYLTSAMKGYKVAVEDVIGIVDKLTAVDLVSATNAGGLAEAMSKTAAIADSAGISMDKLLGYLAAVGEVTGNMPSVGNAFKTIFTRMSDIKDGKLELIDEDGTVETLSNVETVLNNVGIKLRESNNEFRNFGDVLDEVAASWHSYSSVQQASISDAFAGTRQSNNFRLLMENYSNATSYMDAAINSTGTSVQKFSAYTDSIEAKTKSLQASFESLAVNTFSTELFGGIIEATTSLVTFLDKTNLLKSSLAGIAGAGAIKTFVMLASGIANAATRLSEFNSALNILKVGNIGQSQLQQLIQLTHNLSDSQWKAIVSSKALSTQQRMAILTANGMSTAEAKAALSTMGLANATGTATTATFSLSGALKGLWTTLKANPLILVTSAFTAAVTAFNAFSDAAEESARVAAENLTKLKEQAQAVSEMRSSVKALIDQYKDLANTFNGTWSLDQANQLQSIQDNITDLVGTQASNLDLVNGKLDEEYQKLLNIYSVMTQNEFDSAESAYLASKQEYDKGYQRDKDFWGNSKEDDYLASWYLRRAYEEHNGVSASEAQQWWGSQAGFDNSQWLGDIPTALEQIGSYEEGLEKLYEWRSLLIDATNEGFGDSQSNIYDTADALTYLNTKISEFKNIIQDAESTKDRFFSAKANREVLDYLVTNEIESQTSFEKYVNDILADEDITNDYAKALITSMQVYLPEFEIPDSVKKSFIAERDKLIAEITGAIPDSDTGAIGNWLDSMDVSEYEAFVDWIKDNVDSVVVTASLDNMMSAFASYLERMHIAADGLGSATETAKEFLDQLSAIESLSNGFEQLAAIYKDVSDKSSFDFSAILNNDDFKASFGKLDSYENFIKTIANSPDDISACQSAFNSLASDYINTSGILDDLTEETRDFTVAMLEQNGVTNAAIIVDRQLALQKERAANASGNLADKTYDEIVALYSEAEAGSVAQQALAELAVQKFLNNDNPIRTSADIDQLIALANTANITAASLQNVLRAKQLMDQADFFRSQGFTQTAQSIEGAARDVLNNNTWEYEAFNADDYQASYSGGGASGSSSGGTSSSPAVIDWIETIVERIKKAIDKLTDTASNAFKSLKTRLTASGDAISQTYKQIETQQKAYERYMQEAESVGLSENLKQLVRDGAIDISEYDSSTKELIEDYQEWYDKALECSDAIDELHESLGSLYEEQFDAYKEDYSNQIDLFSHLTNTYENQLDLLEANGYLASSKLYSALQDVERQNLALLEEELLSLETTFSEAMASGEIEEYSESWYSMQTVINDTKEAIDEATLSIAENAKAIRDLEWSYFDYTQERISRLTDEADFLIELLGNSDLFGDNGKLTDEGMATIGLYGQNYNTYMALADQYAEEILNINELLADDPNNTELIERKEELLDLQQDAILAAENEKQAIIDLVQDGINLELESLKELIDAYTDALDSAKDLYDYQNKIRNHTSEIGSIRKQLLAYEGDNSEEARAIVQRLQVQLAEAERNLEETEYEKYISDQKKLLDDLYHEYETVLNERLDNTDALIEEMIGSVNLNAESINSTIGNAASDVGYTLTDAMQSIWDGSTDALNGTLSIYGDDFGGKLTAINFVLDQIRENTAAMITSSDEQSQGTIDDTSHTTEPDLSVVPETPPVIEPEIPEVPEHEKEITIGGKINAEGAKIYSYAGDTNGYNQSFSDDPVYTVLDEQDGYLKVRHHSLSNGVTGWFKKSDVKAYKTGGLVDYTGLAWVDGQKTSPEAFLDAEDTENIRDLVAVLRQQYDDQPLIVNPYQAYSYEAPRVSHNVIGIDDLSAIISKISTQPDTTISVGDVNNTFEINIDHVDDYNDFMKKIQKDEQFERFIRSMTVDRLGGKPSLSKYRYRLGE